MSSLLHRSVRVNGKENEFVAEYGETQNKLGMTMIIQILARLFARWLFCLLLLVALGSTCRNASALERPDEGMIAELTRTGQLQQRINSATQLGNHLVDTFLLRKAIARAAQKELEKQGKPAVDIRRLIYPMALPPSRVGMPTAGNVRALALLIDFNDYPHVISSEEIDKKLFGTGDIATDPYESLSAYYSRSSYSKLKITGTTLGWYPAGINRSSVIETRAGQESLIKNALNYYEAQGHDFKQYDSNGDGIIDYLMVLWSGPDNGWSNFWWGKFIKSFTDSSYTLDGVRVGSYSWQWEVKWKDNRPATKSFSPKVVIHETGHALGLPDYYDYDLNIGPRGGVGGLDMMDANQGDHNCFSKWLLDWVSPKVIGGLKQVDSLNASGASQDCIVLWPGIIFGDIFSEFFVVQNRYRVGNDKRLPGDGMLIWHVDARLREDGAEFKYNNSSTEHKLLRLMEADGLEAIERSNYNTAGAGLNTGDAGDYYRQGNNLTPYTMPSSNRYDGSSSGVYVTDISGAGERVTATFAATLRERKVVRHSAAIHLFSHGWRKKIP